MEKFRNGRPVYFMSRDGYYLKKMYDVLYPDRDTFYVYSSRKAFQKATDNYIKYITPFFERDGLWVDGNGSGKSHDQFFETHFGKIPDKCFFSLFHHYNIKGIVMYYTHDDFSYRTRRIIPWAIEFFLQAPHHKIIDVDRNGNPKTIKEIDKHDIYKTRLERDYEKLMPLLSVTQGQIFNEECNNIENYEKSMRASGILAFDLDGTTANVRDSIMKVIIEYAQRTYSIIIITGRNNPLESFYGWMKYITPHFLFYYNSTGKNIPYVKGIQMNHARSVLGVNEKQMCVLVDNDEFNIIEIRKLGYKGILLSSRNISLLPKYLKE
jgi:hypothetical protein